MSSEWWEDAFDADYVRLWRARGYLDGSEADVEAVVRLLGRIGGDVLDVPCGFGRHAGPLHRRGFRVTGIDVSPAQIALAHAENPGPTYLVADMREPPPGPYDVVLNLYSSFGYFDDPADDLAALRAFHQVLRPGGTLVLETVTRERAAALASSEPRSGDADRVDWVAGLMWAGLRDDDGTVKEVRLRLYTVTDLVVALRAAGFADVQVFGGLDGSPYRPEARAVFVGHAAEQAR